jgi:hypothetical protein
MAVAPGGPAVAVAGCAEPDHSGATIASTPPATVIVGPADGGRTVDLEVGDRLIVQLHTGRRPSRLPPAWMVRLPPSKVLKRIQGDPDAARVVLVADGPGTVRLLLVKRTSCAPPLRCPLAAAAPTDQRGRMRGHLWLGSGSSSLFACGSGDGGSPRRSTAGGRR